jgi:hypothetical protein
VLHETIGFVSGLFVILSAVPLCCDVFRGRRQILLGDWASSVFLSFALILTYWSVGAKANSWPVIAAFGNSVVVGLCMLWRKPVLPDGLTRAELMAFAFGAVACVVWIFVHDTAWLAQYPLYLVLFADACVSVPVLLYFCVHDATDKPFFYVMSAIGYGISVFTITEHTVAQYAVPAYMVWILSSCATPLIRGRIRLGIPLRTWREWL